ncbi:MAG: electron transport complex subunit RsxG [Alphaproteobacteria bacterium]|nr:electron transport complex subunit RsxG [Alphaproteobacteria bacterium]MBF0128633.1 electron transport complex subunit RsxG [Alphaproteobacteria bacterium]
MSLHRPTYVHAFILGVFCFGFGILIASLDLVTREDIKLRQFEDMQASLAKVIPLAIHDNIPAEDKVVLKGDDGKDLTVYRATKGGKVTGVAFPIQGSGYAGPIRLMMGVDPEGRILGVRVAMFKETPGLGDKIDEKKSDWILRFTGLSLGNPPVDKWKVKKDGGQFDQFSGATITPRAVVGAIRNGLEFFAANKAQMLEARK